MSFIAGVVRYEMNKARGKSGLGEILEINRVNSIHTLVQLWGHKDLSHYDAWLRKS